MRRIRQAKSEDAAALAACMASAYAVYLPRMGGSRLPPMDVDYRAEIESYPAWVVESEQGLLGGLIMTFEAGQASIANVAVDPRFHGQGIGGELIAFAIETARARGHGELHLATHVLLDENISLYRHLGWRETGRDDTRVRMAKKI